MLTLPGSPARRTTSHSLMPSAMPPSVRALSSGRSAFGLGEAGLAAGIGALARSPAMEPTGRSAGRSGGGAGAAGTSGAADATGALQRPSAPTRSSGATGPRGLSGTFWSPPVAFAQLGVAKTFIGLENKPPSLVSGSRRIELVQPAAQRATPAAQA